MINKLYKDRDWLINQYSVLEKSQPEITKMCGGGDPDYWLKKHGIPMRSRSEALRIAMNKPETKKKKSNALSGNKHPNYIDGRSLYINIHNWVRKNKIKPELCEICRKPKKLYLSNKTGKLIRDINNFQYICYSCHRKYDFKNKIIHEGTENSRI